MGTRLRVMLLDDHEVIRRGLELLLKQEYSIDVVGSFRSSRELFAALKDTRADVIIVDYALGPSDVDGLNLIRALKVRFPHERILVMSSHHNPATVALAMRAGAHGFVGKGQSQSDLITAIRAVAAGRVYVEEHLAAHLSSVKSSAEEKAGDELLGYARLTPREREVLRCVLDGMSVTEIAAKFFRGITTISAQKNSAFRKLGIRTNNELFKIRHLLDKL
jgi:DNA-binding NarL/FixJ family response regulator